VETSDPTRGSATPRFTAAVLGPFRDAWLAARARLTTLAAGGVDAGAVSVEAYHGTVVVAGDVATSSTRDAIVRALRTLSGVVGVDDRIRVHESARPRTMGGDAETRFLVLSALRHAPALRGSTIHLGSVYDGVVTLTGTAPTETVADAAFHLVTQLPGVRRVISDVAVMAHHADAGDTADAA
jgi:osmotically-inducible protein OsmY